MTATKTTTGDDVAVQRTRLDELQERNANKVKQTIAREEKRRTRVRQQLRAACPKRSPWP